MDFPLPGQTAEKPVPAVPKDNGNAASREASHLMRQGAAPTSNERTGSASKDGNVPLYFDPVKGWYAKDKSNNAVLLDAGSKPYYDSARGSWIKPLTQKPNAEVKHLEVPPLRTASPNQAHAIAHEMPRGTGAARLIATELPPPATASLVPRELPLAAVEAQRPVARELPRATDTARPVVDDLFSTAAQVMSRLPGNMQLKFQGKSVAIDADVSKLVDALPFIQISDKGREIAGYVRGIRLDGNHVTLDLKDNFAVPIRNESTGDSVNGLIFGDGQRQVSFDAVFDKSGERMTLRNISGVTIDAIGGRRLGLHELTLNAHRDSPVLTVTYDNPKKTIPLLRRFASDHATMSVPLTALDKSVSVDSIRAAMTTVDDVRNALVNRDSMSLTKGLGDRDLRRGIQEVLSTLQTVTKNGDAIEITRGGGPAALPLGAGGSELIVGQTVRFRSASDKLGPTLSSIQGIDMRVPMLGSGSELRMTLKGLSTGVDSRGRKVIKVHSD